LPEYSAGSVNGKFARTPARTVIGVRHEVVCLGTLAKTGGDAGPNVSMFGSEGFDLV
jgi:hypothetical protein